MTKRVITITAALSAAVALGAAMLEIMTVQRASVAVRVGKGRATTLVTEVTRGQTVEVLERSGNWVKLKSGDKTGWSHKADLEPKKQAEGNIKVGGLQVGEVEEAGAGKGVGADAKIYAKQSGASTEPLEKLQKRRDAITDKGEWMKFAQEGNVGVGAR